MEHKRMLLIVDDIKSNREILKNMLGGDYDIIEAEHGREAVALMTAEYENISAILLDLGMPVMDGFEVLSYMQGVEALKQLPVIVTTGQTDTGSEEKALRLGAKDYIAKPYKSAIIKQRILNTIILRETSATVNALRRDRLTGLYSRDAFFDNVSKAVGAHEPGYYIMASFDVDKFKVINDQYGNEKGDEALRHIAGVFRNGFNANGGFCCRISADDFAAFYPAEFKDSDKLAQIREKASMIPGISTPVVFTIGRYIINDTRMLPSAMYDRALLAANSIRGQYDVRIAVYDESMRDKLIENQQIVSEMKAALEEKQFEIWYQPQYNHATGALVGAEALVRWRHPVRGLISPAVFIPVFEQNGFIYQLDKYVWEGVCRYLCDESNAGRSPLPVSVNISRNDVFKSDFFEYITGLIDKYKLPVELLRLEITESAFSEDTKRIVDMVKRLIAFGFTLEIDDFGSGYSSLNTLKSVPAQVVKLDMRFFEGDEDSEERGGNIIESVVRMTKWLGMSVIAEGVEEKEQADFLGSIGCNYIQGYLYSKPVPEAEYREVCYGTDREEKLLVLETVDNLDNNSFWNPKSMDTLIFNSYVGAACIFEYCEGKVELLRVSPKYIRQIAGAEMHTENALRLDWAAHLTPDGKILLRDSLEESKTTRSDVQLELMMLGIPHCPGKLYLRFDLRVIATAGKRNLVYCFYENMTEQREAERHGREMTGQLQAVLDNVAGGITAVRLSGDTASYVLANGKYYELIGYTKEQYEAEIGSHPYNIIYPDDREMLVKIVSDVVTNGDSRKAEYRIIRRDGAIAWLQSNISMATLDGIKEPVQLSTFIDITEQKSAELALRSTSELLQEMMDDMPGGFARIRVFPDGTMKPVYINEGLGRLSGMTHDEIMKLYENDAFAGVHPDDILIVRNTVREILEKGEAHSARYRLKHKSGSHVWLSIFGRTTVDASGNTYLNIYYTDATEKVRDEERQRELLDNLSYGVALYEYDGSHLSVIHINDRYWELVGREKSIQSGEAFVNAIYQDDKASVMNELNLAIKEKRDFSGDVRILYGENEYRPFHISGRILQKKDGNYAIYAAYTPISTEAMSIQEILPIALSAVMNSQSDYAFVKDKSLRYVCCSLPVVKLSGHKTESELLGKSDYEVFDRAIADAFRVDDTRILETGESLVDNIDRIPSPDGNDRYASTSKYPLRDSHGNIVGVLGVGRDVTEARSMKSRFDLLANSIPGGIATYEYKNGKLTLTYFNDGFCKLFDTTREEYERLSAGDPSFGIFSEDLPELYRQLEAMLHDGAQADLIYRVRSENGVIRWINMKAGVSERYEEKIIFNAVLFDITRRHDSIEKMRISEEENRLAIQHTQNTVCRYDVVTGTLTVPERVKDRYAFPAEVVNVPEGQIAAGMISPDTADAYMEFYTCIRKGNENGSAVFKRMSKKGWRWIEGHFSTIFSADGEPVSAVISFADVTVQIKKDTAYRRWKQSFAGRAPESYSLYRYNLTADKYIDEHEGSLIDFALNPENFGFNEYTTRYISQCVCGDDVERFTQFLNTEALLAGYYQGKSIVSLEYREKLPEDKYRWIRLNVDMVELSGSSEIEAYLLFSDIDNEKRHELTIIEQAETDPLTGVLNRSTFELQVEHLIKTSKPHAQHALLMLDMDGFKRVNDIFGHSVGDQTIIDIADKVRSVVRQGDLVSRLGGDEFLVFIPDVPNDLVAATKAQQLCAVARKSFSVEVEISASLGIALFPRDGEDFNSLYKKADAALYFVKGSGKNNYAFYRSDMADEHLSYQQVMNNENTVSRTYKKRRMLIVDDSRIDHAMLSNIFSEQFIIEKAKDGNAALIGLQHYGSAISVVLLDLMMPGMDGFAVLKKMRENPEIQNIPVIVVSGDENRETSLRAIREGAVDFVSKPVDTEILRIRVQSAISRAENERLRAHNSELEFQNDEVARYRTALESSGTFVIENDWVSGTFLYDNTVSGHLAGKYDDRGLWHILLSDFVADTETVQKMQNMVQHIAAERVRTSEKTFVSLKAPDNTKHWFRLNVQKISDEYGLTGKIYLIFTDHGTEPPEQ